MARKEEIATMANFPRLNYLSLLHTHTLYTHSLIHTHTHSHTRTQTQKFAAEVVRGDTERKLWLFIFPFFYIYIGKADNKLCHYIVKQIVKCLHDLCMIPSHYSC